jgi:hypothetical protein
MSYNGVLTAKAPEKPGKDAAIPTVDRYEVPIA